MSLRKSSIYIFVVVLLFVFMITPASESFSAKMEEEQEEISMDQEEQADIATKDHLVIETETEELVEETDLENELIGDNVRVNEENEEKEAEDKELMEQHDVVQQNLTDDGDKLIDEKSIEKRDESEHKDVSFEENREIVKIEEEKKGNSINKKNELRQVTSITPKGGLLDAIVVSEYDLQANLVEDANPQITLEYTGKNLINLGLIKNTYIIFHLPEEIIREIENNHVDIQAFYDVPQVGLIIPIIRKQGEFSPEDIQIADNQIIMNFTQLLSLNLLSNSYCKFRLKLVFHHGLPTSRDGEYVFMSQATNQIINLTLLGTSNVAMTTLQAPTLTFDHIPETLEFEEVEIPSQPQYVYRKEDFTLSILDTRKSSNRLRIDAHIEKPLTNINDDSVILRDALKFKMHDGTEFTLSNEPVTIFSGTTGSNPITTISWSKEEGPLIYVRPSEVRTGEYSTNIIWTIVDAP